LTVLLSLFVKQNKISSSSSSPSPWHCRNRHGIDTCVNTSRLRKDVSIKLRRSPRVPGEQEDPARWTGQLFDVVRRVSMPLSRRDKPKPRRINRIC